MIKHSYAEETCWNSSSPSQSIERQTREIPCSDDVLGLIDLPNDANALRNSFLSIDPLLSVSKLRKIFSHCVMKFHNDLNSGKSIVEELSVSNMPENKCRICLNLSSVLPAIPIDPSVQRVELTDHHPNRFLNEGEKSSTIDDRQNEEEASYRIERTPRSIGKGRLEFVGCDATWIVTIDSKPQRWGRSQRNVTTHLRKTCCRKVSETSPWLILFVCSFVRLI